jgi:alkanesulfonate monooxygenase SsuD/methylene tetrahydromethanopterin reductase-like flavin-dependent oxidoreductase (luciferase family)
VAKIKKSVKGKTPPESGKLPTCVAFLLCERVIISTDGTASIIRIVDTVGVPEDPARKKNDYIELGGIQTFVAIKRIDSDPVDLVVSCIDRRGKRSPVGILKNRPEVTAQGGTNAIAPLRLRWSGEGMYWLELATADGRLVGKTPFQVVSGSPEQVAEKIKKANQNESR